MNKIIDDHLDEHILNQLIVIMPDNPYMRFFRTKELQNHIIRIRTDVQLDQRVYNGPTVDQVASIRIEGIKPSVPYEREIKVYFT